jgi:hypothetical protein
MILKKPDYTKQGYELIRDIIGIIRFYQYHLNKTYYYRPYNYYKAKKHLETLRNDLRLHWKIIRFLKHNKRG